MAEVIPKYILLLCKLMSISMTNALSRCQKACLRYSHIYKYCYMEAIMHVHAFDDSNLYRLPFSVEVRSRCVRTYSILLFTFSCMGVHLEVNVLPVICITRLSSKLIVIFTSFYHLTIILHTHDKSLTFTCIFISQLLA